MPDWFYRTVARPALFAAPERIGRGVALGLIGFLGRRAWGKKFIEFLGHMEPDPQLMVRVGLNCFDTPIGLGWRVDPEQRATEGLSAFGIGFIEERDEQPRDVLRGGDETLRDGLPLPPHQQKAGGDRGAPVLRRRFDPNRGEHVLLPSGEVLRVVGDSADPGAIEDERFDGVVLQTGAQQEAGVWLVPAKMSDALPALVRRWRDRLGPKAVLMIAGGIAGPENALTLIGAGADLLAIDAGMVFRGPGLIKRCNEALLTRSKHLERAAEVPSTAARQAWFWTVALGLALVFGGFVTLVLALTRVLLPYDESYLDITSSLLRRSMPRLFAFMAHDRATLAGTMIGLGWFYSALGWSGMRRGIHGARTAVVGSALAGFASFFAFFGFGYFDTLHAFVAALLFQFTVQIMVGTVAKPGNTVSHSVDRENQTWQRAQWGQLLWIIHAVGLLIAGATILGIGMTSVLVKADLGFLCLGDTPLQTLGSRLLAVVAHDRATLGGMLLASGVASLLVTLWCYRRGEAWLWGAIAGLGLPAYTAALGIHFWVGYTDGRHLLPAFAGLCLWSGGLGLSRGYLVGTNRLSGETPP